MLMNLTYKQKNIGLLVIAFVFAFIAYFGAVKHTFALYSSCTDFESKLSEINDAPKQIAYIEKQLKDFDNIFGKNDNYNEQYQQYIMETVSNYCNVNNVVLKEFPKPFVFTEQDFIVETNKITVEGSFGKLLNLAYLIEQKKKLGKISSLLFQTFTRNIENQKYTYLSLTIYLQHIKSIKNEK